MVMRRSVGQVLDQQTDKKEYFNSKYSFPKVTGMKEGMEVYCIPLNLENGLYELARHTVKARGPKQGFKGWYTASIICKGVREDGTKDPNALCCQLAQAEYNKYPGKDDYSKRMISFTSNVTYLPVLILGCIDSAKGALKVPPSKLSIKTYQFSYLEMSSNSFNKEILTPFVNKLKDDGVVSYEAEGEELQAQVMEQLSHTLIKVTANHTDKKGIPYERSYSFVSFNNQNIGKESDQYKYITNYNKISKIKNDIVDYITLFDSEVDGLCKDWTDEELETYINVDSVRSAQLKEAVEGSEVDDAIDRMNASVVPPKSEQVVTLKEEPKEEIILGEEEISFDEDFGSIEEASVHETSQVTETFEDINDNDLMLDVDDEFFTDDEQ